MSNYMDYMIRFSYSDLQEVLGQDIIDLLIEWFPAGDNSLTKKRMVELINSIYGANILNEKEVRKNLLLSMDETQIFDIRDKFLAGKDKSENNPVAIANAIVKRSWGHNRLTEYLLALWGVSDDILDNENDDTVHENIIESSGEQFYELLDYQFYIKQRSLNILNSGPLKRMLVHMPTGTGKTKTTMHILIDYYIFTLKKKGAIIWVAHKQELLQQAYDTLLSVWSHLGDGLIKTYKLWGDYDIDDTNDPINGMVFCGLKKLMEIAKRNPSLFDRLKQDCRLLVFDEAHKAAAKKTQDVINEIVKMPPGFENRALIGLTATPGRSTVDSFDNNLLTNMFDGTIIHIDTNIINQINLGELVALNTVPETNIIKYFQERHILAKMIPHRLTYESNFSEHELNILQGSLRNMGYGDKEYTEEQLEILAKNKARNLEILRQLRRLNVDKIPTIVFACSIDHAKMMSAMLTLEGIPNSLVIGKMPPTDRKRAIEAFKNKDSPVNIIINYEILTTGFDSKNIKCVFITRPTKSIVLYSQMLGRGLRGPLMGGNEECTLIDIDDNLKAFDNETAFSYFDAYWNV